jgi:hypothetical protein
MPSHLKILKIKRPRYISIEIQVPPWDRHENVAGLNGMMGSHVILNVMESDSLPLNKNNKCYLIRFCKNAIFALVKQFSTVRHE